MPEQVSRPLLLEELVSEVRARPARQELTDVPLQLSLLVNAAEGLEVDYELAAVKSEYEDDRTAQLNLRLHGAKLGQHAFPPQVATRRFEPEASIRERQQEQPGFDGFLPKHLPLRPLPQHLPERFKIPRRIGREVIPQERDELHQATTVFAPDNRYTFNDTAFPWCTTGRIDTPGGTASGVMVGPRHVLTCSHAIQWNNDGSAGWVKFTPSYFDGSAPFGVAWGTWVYWEGIKVVGPTINSEEGRHDYVCVVLNWNIGNVTGWMGSRTYSDSWDNEAYWAHIGYPSDLASAERPSYQSAISLDGSFWDPEAHQRIYHLGDVWPGQSGGPYFAWWSGEDWPRVVAVQSGETPSTNSASGGAHMVDCIIRARNDFP